jgi:hypothetical protein
VLIELLVKATRRSKFSASGWLEGRFLETKIDEIKEKLAALAE